ncbi:twin-arginine translocase subunit TatC [Synoicihabitans lomoniglobus]|uniref:Sec-independent protein translocase protein TatC n=1 Tax=Synoicihabitans lomoniglobus TaxID=2909285 RepID=A0AAE9ZTW9_9BACT|nr:twin-arginine translocase subunit TatC [Opitutaceae bacterium LMO-M01]WED63221.1 twin-arginine translocase subunit TatC [Opitutaceae bacterium LMO-M01]
MANDDDEQTELMNADEASGASLREKPMAFFDHLEELRWTLVKSAIAFAVCAAVIGISLKQFNELMLWPLHSVQADYPNFVVDLGTTSVMEGFTVVIQMCFVGGLIMAAPLMLYFLGQFIAPALHEKEFKLVLPGCIAAMMLFLMGVCFSFFLLVPGTIRVSIELNQLFGFITRWTPGSYYGTLIWLTLGVGAAFEFPLLIVLLVHLGLLTSAKLRGWWRHSLVLCFVVAAFVTPTPDPINQSVLALSLYILYWVAIVAAVRVEKRAMKAAMDEEL